MLGLAIAGGLMAASSIIGGIQSAKAARKQQRALEDQQERIEQQQRENQAWYERRYNEDPTQRADVQRVLRMTEDAIRRRNEAAAGTQAVMGGSEESVAATKEANARAMADATSQIVAANESRKDAIEQQYLNRKDALNGQLNQNDQAQAEAEAQRQQAIAGAIQGVGNAAANIVGGLSGTGGSTRVAGSAASQSVIDNKLSSASGVLGERVKNWQPQYTL